LFTAPYFVVEEAVGATVAVVGDTLGIGTVA
jgi:hypothetical protein